MKTCWILLTYLSLLNKAFYFQIGFRLSPQAVTAITKRYSTQGKIAFDDYIACCVKLRALTGMLDSSLVTVIRIIYFNLIKPACSLYLEFNFGILQKRFLLIVYRPNCKHYRSGFF